MERLPDQNFKVFFIEILTNGIIITSKRLNLNFDPVPHKTSHIPLQ